MAHTPKEDPIAQAVTALLTAAGCDLHHADFSRTPARVADLWRAEFLSGYHLDAKAICTGAVVDESSSSAVLITGLAFHSLCPHHLLPAVGHAHVAYLPAGKLLGFGAVAQLVDCFTKRLTLQERATEAIAQSLITELGAAGAGCILEATHLCLALPADTHRQSRVVTSNFLGAFEERPELRQALWAAVGKEGLLNDPQVPQTSHDTP